MSHQSIKNEVQSKLRRYEDLNDRRCLVEVVEIIFKNAVSNPELIPLLIGICKNHVSDDFIIKFSEKAESSLRRILSSERRNMMRNEDRNIIQLVGQLFINNLMSIDIIKKFIHNLFQSIQDPTKWSLANESNVQLGIVLIRNIGCVIDISENGPIHFWFGILEHVEPFLGNKTREMINDLMKLRKNGWNREKEIDEKNARINELEQEVGNFKIRALTEQQRQIDRGDNQQFRNINKELENQVTLLNNKLRAKKIEFENLMQINKILNSNNEELVESLKFTHVENEELKTKLESFKSEVQIQMTAGNAEFLKLRKRIRELEAQNVVREVYVEEEDDEETQAQPSTSNLCAAHQLQNTIRQLQHGQVANEDETAMYLYNLIYNLK
ncbi:unnamed protein product [Caenorhabditis angaria]|uniref:MIF4G domain-containing protein n=1 Tax=Caenorhabditis angaria TaxID=860376 RepID=A0A9P1N249_9PELO|nr:unnamed protein product [Caenorhabditis angaria]